MPRRRHDNPYAEQRIRELGLPGRPTRAELERKAEQEARRAKRAAELAAVDWESLTPAELAFRWFSDRHKWGDRSSVYAQWAAASREAWKQRREGGH
jgi:hypothetical protein